MLDPFIPLPLAAARRSLSVIICTHNRAAVLQPCLEALSRSVSHAGGIDVEVIVVANACTDNTVEIVRAIAAEHSGFRLRCALEPRKGLSRARNLGLLEASGDLLVMIDDDCHMAPDYITRVLEYDVADASPTLRGGSVLLGDPTDLPLTIKTETEAKTWLLAANTARHENLGNSLLGCNMVMRREVTETLGSFDPGLGAGSPIQAGEDIDYAFRAYLAGFPVHYAPDLTVLHFHGRKDAKDGYALFRNYSIGGGALYAKYMFVYPALCRQIYWDLKGMPKEWLQRTNLFRPDIAFSLTDKVRFSLLGMARYWAGRATRRIRS